MIYINPTTRKFDLGDDNLWLWLQREFDAQLYNKPLKSNDILINSSFHKLASESGTVINLHLELMKELYDKYPELKGYEKNVQDILYNCKYSNLTVIPSKLMYKNYSQYSKNLKIVPIGVDTEVFKALNRKEEFRDKYKLPKNKTIGFWSGNTGVWRGVDDLKTFAKNNSSMHWIINYYRGPKISLGQNCSVFYRISQKQINELLDASDFYLCTNQLGPYYMSDWEAIAADVLIVDTTSLERELGEMPNREKLIEAGWDRTSVKKVWEQIFNDYNI